MLGSTRRTIGDAQRVSLQFNDIKSCHENGILERGFMQNDLSRQLRAVVQIEQEFAGMLLQHWSPDAARQRFEALWDEVNSAAIKTLGSDGGDAYIALLSRMQYEFDKRYVGVPLYQVACTAREMR